MPRSKIIYGDEVLIDLTGDTVQPETLGVGVTAHDAAGNPITGTMTGGKPEQTKTVTPKASAQTVTPDSGYTLSSVTVNAVPTQTKTATPSAASQDVTPDSGKFLSKVTVSGDSNLVAGNIKSGVSIFGVAGTYEGNGGGGGNAETCTITFATNNMGVLYAEENGLSKYVIIGRDVMPNTSVTCVKNSAVFIFDTQGMTGPAYSGGEIIYEDSYSYSWVILKATENIVI